MSIRYLSKIVMAAALTLNSGVFAFEAEDLERVDLLVNNSFEDGEDLAPVDWVFVNEHDRTQGNWSKAEAHSGKQSLYIKSFSGLDYGRWNTAARLVLEGGKKYYFGAWVKGRGNGLFRAYLEGYKCEYDSENAVLTETKLREYKPELFKQTGETNANKWTLLSRVFSTPDYPLWGKICLESIGEYEAYIDDVMLIKIDALNLVSPQIPITVGTGEEFTVEVLVADEALNPRRGIDDFRIFPEHVKLQKVQFDEPRGIYRLSLKGEKEFFGDILINSKTLKDTLKLNRLIRVTDDKNTNTFSFAVISDAHFDKPNNQTRLGRAREHIAAINNLNLDFVLNCGDNNDSCNGFDDLKRKMYCHTIQKMFGEFNMPIYTVAGNHEYDRNDAGALSRWYFRRYMGKPYYFNFEYGNFNFVGLDANHTGVYGDDHRGSFIMPGQMPYLEKTLAQARERGKENIVFFHEAIDEGGQFVQDENREKVLKILAANEVKLVLNGHNHHDWAFGRPWNKITASSGSDTFSSGPVVDNNLVLREMGQGDRTVFLQTGTFSGFPLGGATTYVWRYVWVKDGKIVYTDSIPMGVKINIDTDSSKLNAKVKLVNPTKRLLEKVPVRLQLAAAAAYKATDAAGHGYEIFTVSGKNGNTLWIQVDIPPESTTELTVEADRK